MPIRPLLPIIVLLALSGCVTTGLHNSTKVFTEPSDMRPSDWSDPAEMERAWQAALVRIPKSGGGYVSTTIAELQEGHISPEGVWPTVIYMHGCTGIWSGTKTRINLLARNGYAVVAPASFARLKYPQSCRPDNQSGWPLPPDAQDAPKRRWLCHCNDQDPSVGRQIERLPHGAQSGRDHDGNVLILASRAFPSSADCRGLDLPRGLDRVRRDQRTGIRACADFGWGQRSVVPESLEPGLVRPLPQQVERESLRGLFERTLEHSPRASGGA